MSHLKGHGFGGAGCGDVDDDVANRLCRAEFREDTMCAGFNQHERGTYVQGDPVSTCQGVKASTRRGVNASTRQPVDMAKRQQVDASTHRRVNASMRRRVDALMR